MEERRSDLDFVRRGSGRAPATGVMRRRRAVPGLRHPTTPGRMRHAGGPATSCASWEAVAVGPPSRQSRERERRARGGGCAGALWRAEL